MTLNQIIDRLKSLSLSHKQVNSFYFGDPFEFDVNGEIKYPACFAQLLPFTFDRTLHLQTFRFRIYFLDLVGVATDTEGNETEVISDMASIGGDFLAMLMGFDLQDDWIISDTNTGESLTEVLGDMAAGIYLDVSISSEFLADRCQVPSDDVVFTDIGGNYVIVNTAMKPKMISYTADGTEGNTFTVAELAGKTVLAAFRAGYFKRITTAAPTDYEMIKVAGTQITGAIEASTGAMTLQANDNLVNGEKIDFLYYGS